MGCFVSTNAEAHTPADDIPRCDITRVVPFREPCVFYPNDDDRHAVRALFGGGERMWEDVAAVTMCLTNAGEMTQLSARDFYKAWNRVFRPVTQALWPEHDDARDADDRVPLDILAHAVQLMIDARLDLDLLQIAADAVDVLPQGGALKCVIRALIMLIEHPHTVAYCSVTRATYGDEYMHLWLREVVMRAAYIVDVRHLVDGTCMVPYNRDTFASAAVIDLSGASVYQPFECLGSFKIGDNPDASLGLASLSDSLLETTLSAVPEDGGGYMLVCGGVVLRALSQIEFDDQGDIDIFMIGYKDVASASRAIIRCMADILSHMTATGTYVVLMTPNACTLVCQWPEVEKHTIQFIMRMMRTAEEVLINFDLGACSGCHGRGVTQFTERGRWSIANSTHVADVLQRSTASRPRKYGNRGFKYVIPVPAPLWPALRHCVFTHSQPASPLVDPARGMLAAVVALSVGKKTEGFAITSALYTSLKHIEDWLHYPTIFQRFKDSPDGARFKAWRIEYVPERTVEDIASDLRDMLTAEACLTEDKWLIDQPSQRSVWPAGKSFFSM